MSNLERSIEEQIQRLDVRLFFIEQMVKQNKHQMNDIAFETIERDKYNEMESNGTLMWDGGRKTRFWIDPEEEMIGILMTQLRGGNWRIHQVFRNLAYQTIVD